MCSKIVSGKACPNQDSLQHEPYHDWILYRIVDRVYLCPLCETETAGSPLQKVLRGYRQIRRRVGFIRLNIEKDRG